MKSSPQSLHKADDDVSFHKNEISDDSQLDGETSNNMTYCVAQTGRRVSFLTVGSFFNDDSNNSALFGEDSCSNFADVDEYTNVSFTWNQDTVSEGNGKTASLIDGEIDKGDTGLHFETRNNINNTCPPPPGKLLIGTEENIFMDGDGNVLIDLSALLFESSMFLPEESKRVGGNADYDYEYDDQHTYAQDSIKLTLKRRRQQGEILLDAKETM